MIALLGASALTLAALQASIAAPTSAFRGCLHDAAAKATSEKVSADTIDTYLRSACTVQMSTLKAALVDFRLKNGMGKKAAGDDAEMTIDDYVSTPADNYKFEASENTPKDKPAISPSTPPVQPAAQPTSSQPHKP
ncbi:MAG TPA: hypothetical protein VHS33_13690 [Sphingomicrobium sp.]|jgi:hypothetical protein|nr:hypothetical protein [Sphingomicrobium sp.]